MAATEFAVISPIFVVVLLGVAGIGGAVSSQFSVERKVRLAVEGVIRFGWDDVKIVNFANADGARAFGQTSQSDGITLGVTKYRVCRGSGLLQEILMTESAPCAKPEMWVKITAAKSVSGPFGSSLNLKSRADVMAEP